MNMRGIGISSLMVCLLFSSAVLALSPDVPVQHVVVYSEEGRFCGWPANQGIWSWGNEIAVGFKLGYWTEKKGHDYDEKRPSYEVISRSKDGGHSWVLEMHLDDLNSRMPVIEVPEDGFDFSNPDFAMAIRRGVYYISYDRGRNWAGRYEFPRFMDRKSHTRTDYIINGKSDCMFFAAVEDTDKREGVPLLARTTDGGKNIDFVSWIGPDHYEESWAIMPAAVRCSKEKLVVVLRQKKEGVGSLPVYESTDNGNTFQYLSNAAVTGIHNGNPPSNLIRLDDGSLCASYCYRSEPMGLRAVISRDEGKSWGEPAVLREDAREWDMGYPRMVKRPDGKLFAAYYYTTEKIKHQHIAGTIFDPERVFNKQSAAD